MILLLFTIIIILTFFKEIRTIYILYFQKEVRLNFNNKVIIDFHMFCYQRYLKITKNALN